MAYVQSVIIVLLVNQASIAAAVSGERTIVHQPAAIIGQEHSNQKRQDDAGHTARSRRNSGRRRGVEPWQRSRDVAPKSLRASRTDAGGRGSGYGCRRRGSI